MQIIKRSGEEQPFDARKIRNAIRKANATVSSVDELTDEQMDRITGYVTKACEGFNRPVGVEEIQDIVEKQLMAMGAFDVAKNYIIYRKKRERARDTIKVRGGLTDKGDVTDRSLLLVNSMTGGEASEWDRSKIIARLISALDISQEAAADIAKDVESQVIASGLKMVSSALVRELVNNALIDHGFKGQLRDLTMYPVPRDFIEGLLRTKTVENSNIVNNNPEAVSFDIVSLVLKQYAFDAVFSTAVSSAHAKGSIHVHDSNLPTRLYCGSHSIEYIKKYGLKGICTLSTRSKPAKTASVLTGHLNTFLASMQAYYAGAFGLGYVNVFYAPYLVGMTDEELHQVAQEIIFNLSQNAFSRGSQVLFSDVNLHSEVPGYLKVVPAIGPGGRYYALPMYANVSATELWRPLEERTTPWTDDKGDTYDWSLWLDGKPLLLEKDGVQTFVQDENYRILTYKDVEPEVRRFAKAMLQVWEDGDADGHVFEFPKCDFHVSAETFTNLRSLDVYQKACEVASHNGSTYFVFDRDSVSLASCCRLKVQVTDMSLLHHPERLRTVGFGNVTVNIPQCAYRAKRRFDALEEKTDDKLWELVREEIFSMMDLARDAHLQKKAFLEGIMVPGAPMWQIAKPANDGRPYMKLEDCVYIIGMIGVNDAIQFLTGEEMHESDKAMDLALGILADMNLRVKQYTAETGLVFKLEESPAESAARRLAKADLVHYRDEALKVFRGGSEDVAYYTNSIHLDASAPVSLVERIRKQSMFHSAIESGAIIHAFIGEEHPTPGAISELVRRTFLDTQCAQLVFSPEFTYCSDCGASQRGLKETCDQCGSTHVEGITRVVGYFSRINKMVPLQRELY